MSEPVREDVALRLDRVSKSFGSTHAVRNVSLEIRRGNIHALLGENGAGKSTLISILSGFLAPDTGRVRIADEGEREGFRSPAEALAAGIATVYQHTDLVSELTVRQNIALQSRADQALAERVMSELSLRPISPHKRVASLDVGSRTVVEVARAISMHPQILILDEPTALVATEVVERLLAALKQLAGDGTTVLIVTHKLSEVLDVADDVTVMRDGAISAEFSGEQLGNVSAEQSRLALLEAMFGKAHAPDSLEPPDFPLLVQCSGEMTPVLEITGDDGMNLSVAAGEVFGIAGIAGSGQQRLAELIEGTQRARTVRILLDGNDVTLLGVRERHELGIQSLTDERFAEGLIPSMSVELNLVLKQLGRAPFWRRGVTNRGAIAAHAAQTIAQHHIRVASAVAPASSLSGGNAQKLLLARDAQPDARVTVFRQPTQGLDVKTAETVHAAIRSSAAHGQAVVLISSDLDEIVALSDRIAVLEAGVFVRHVTGHLSDTRELVTRAMSGVES